jgi:hypothetical protein
LCILLIYIHNMSLFVNCICYYFSVICRDVMTRDYTCFFISELKENSTGNYEESEVEETDSV